MNNRIATPITAAQYAVIRVLLGMYLLIHFVDLMPYGRELFSSAGLLPASQSPLMGILPNPLLFNDSPMMVSVLLGLGAISGVLIAMGYFDRAASIFAVLLLGWLFARNPLIANPSLPVVGWMLIAHALIPANAYAKWSTRGQAEQWASWFYPRSIWIAAWILLAVAYSYSGYTKVLSPSWMDGSAIRLVLENPLARDHFLRVFLLDLPPIFLQLLTWAVLVIELLFIPLCFHATLRKWAWLAMLLIQFGFLTFLNFADLTFPMLLIHLLTFDRRWLPAKTDKAMLYFDGQCAFCHGTVRFALAEDHQQNLTFAPLQGDTFKQSGLSLSKDDSIILHTETGEHYTKSDAVIACLHRIGGFWRVPAWILGMIPRIVRNAGYDLVGAIRYRLAGKVEGACQLLPAVYSQQLKH